MDGEEIRPHLYCIPLKQEVNGFEQFIGSWVFTGEWNFIVDVGPKASFEALWEVLKKLKIAKLDFVFLTHIHIDHAGALGSLIRHFPQVKAICHASGVKHLIDPQALWEGSKKVLGDLALKYGPIDPVPEKNLISSEEFNVGGFKVVNTPGHAAHHISLVYGDYLFAGEAGGVFQDLGDRIYLRPATPPRFILEEAVGSVDKLLEVEAQEICYAHFGIHPEARKMLQFYRDQLFLWRDVIQEQMKNPHEQDVMERCITALLERDPLFRGFRNFKEGEKGRELYFTQNSIRGYLEYLRFS